MKHSKGPFTFTETHPGCHHIHSDEHYKLYFLSPSFSVPKEEHMANVLLFSAAPKLLAALELALECGMATGIDGSYPEAWEQMELAVAEAKGEAP